MGEEKVSSDLEKPEQIIDDTVTELDNLHKTLVEGATQIGFARDTLKDIRPVWVKLGNAVVHDPSAQAVYHSGVVGLSAFRDQVSSVRPGMSGVTAITQDIAGTALYFAASTATTSSLFPVSVQIGQDAPAPSSLDRHQEFIQRFSKFDKALGSTYQAIWEALYGLRAEPERAALYLIRQAFDQLFDKLAPDDEVRKSNFWMRKQGDKPDQIWREERIQFAAFNHVKDKFRAEVLSSNAKNMLDVYQALNRAHDRGEMDTTKARTALYQMQRFLEEWANAIGIGL